jgi:1,4-dihydroxy-2-naphthoate octaprenyltransferase
MWPKSRLEWRASLIGWALTILTFVLLGPWPAIFVAMLGSVALMLVMRHLRRKSG